MAAIVLSCSPSCSSVTVTPPHRAAAAMSSSPGLPSPSRIVSSMGPNLMGGSRATPIPPDAAAGFASASTLLQRARSNDEVNAISNVEKSRFFERYDLHSSGKVTSQLKELRGEEQKVPLFKMPSMLHERPSEIVQEEIIHTVAARPANLAEDVGILAPKKSRKKKSKDESKAQTTIKATKITKPITIDSGKKAVRPKKKVKEAVPAQLTIPASTQEEDLRAKEEFRALCLEKAIARRKDWTPTKDTARDPAPSEAFENLDTPLANGPLISRFGELLGDFGFSEKGSCSLDASKIARDGNGEALVKKRRIEFVNSVPAPRVSEKPKRCKSPKKKPQTVTEKATAPFASVDSTNPPSLLQYFGAPKAESVIPTKDAADNADTPVAVRPRPPVEKAPTTKPKTRKAKQPVQKQPILLSPESAVKNARNQELIFGTSSQLAREESPAFLRDLQQAMKESELTVDLKQAPTKDYEFLDLPSGRSRSSNVRAITASKSLWSAASRDVDGSLIEVEIVNLADTPKPIPATTNRISVLKMPETMVAQPKGEDSISAHADESISTAPKLDPNEIADLGEQPKETDFVMPRSVAEAALKTRPKGQSNVKKASMTDPTTNQMPNYKGFTDIQLRKAVAAYGFKTINSREAMITLLERCWQSKTSMALQEVPGNVILPLPTAAESTNVEKSKQRSPSKKRGRPSKASEQVASTADIADDVPSKKPRGRPKKDPTATTPPKRKRKTKKPLSEALVTGADDEIYDSSPPTPSPPKRRSSPKSPGQLQLSQPPETSAINATKTTKGRDRAHLLSQITKAITSFPPTHDVKNLTWHEKILMYDPIVLEDLTVWLNAKGLGEVGEDDEVWPGLVKEWCEERSVCCLWRENLRGGARGRW